MFAEFFIKRPIFAVVCAIVMVLAGALAIPTLPIAQYPMLAPPAVSVTTNYPGASAEVVETSVTIPIEQSVNGVDGVRSISSVSGSDGTSAIYLMFDTSRDIDIAAVDVQNRVSQVLSRLPNEVRQKGVTVEKNTASWVMATALYSENGEYDQKFLSNYANIYLKDAIKRVPGVSKVDVFAERKFAMRVWLRPDQLAFHALAASDVIAALYEQNVQVAAGQLGSQPAVPWAEYQIGLEVHGRLQDAREFENIVLRTTPNGAFVRLKDVARVELGSVGYSSFLRYNGQESSGLGIMKLPSANALDVRNGVVAKMDELKLRFPPGLRWVVSDDTTRAVRSSVREVVKTLIEAIILVVLVIFLFLQSKTSTLIPAITIPVSLIGTFAFVKAFNFSINTLTLFGLTLATGLVVDDAIVVIENVQRFIDEKGLNARQAASAAMREVSGAVVATSMVLIAVFSPAALLPGTSGRIYQQFALTIAFSVALSMFNSLTLTPTLAARWLRKTPTDKAAGFKLFDRLFGALQRTYLRLLQWLIRRRAVSLIAFALAFGAAVALLLSVPVGFFPDEDDGGLRIVAQGPTGMSGNYTRRIVDKIEKIVRSIPEVDNSFELGGWSFSGVGPNRAVSFIALKPWSERKGKEHSVQAIIDRIRGPLAAIEEAIVFPIAPPPVDGIGEMGGLEFQLQDQGGSTVHELERVTKAFVEQAAKSPVLSGVNTSFTADSPYIEINVNRDRAKQLGVKITDLFDTLQVFVGSKYINDFTFENRSYSVYVQGDKEYRADPNSLSTYYVRSSGSSGEGLTPTGLPVATSPSARVGTMITLDNLIETVPKVSATEISHYNLFRAASINASPARGRSTGEAIAEMEQLARTHLPRGYGFEWAGLAKEQVESGARAILIFGLAILAVFLVLAAQYESFALPSIVLLSVPIGIVGALLGQLIRGQVNDVFCQIGLVMLIGLSAKNAILIVEFAHHLRGRGLSIADAALEAARERLRPILMTSFAFILGVFPLVIASGSGALARQSLGTTVFGGMLVSTVANLFFVPSLYVMIESIRERFVKPESGL